MFRYPGFGCVSYSEMPGQFRQDIAAVQKKFVFRMQWLYTRENDLRERIPHT